MNPIILNGKLLAQKIALELKEKVLKLKSQNIDVKLKIIQVGEIEASTKYVNSKIKKAQELGVKAEKISINENILQKELEQLVSNESKNCDGIIVQLPLPKHIDSQKILNKVPLNKDIDGLSTLNKEQFYLNNPNAFAPATAKAVLTLLKEYNITLKNKKCYVIGESDLVGKPTKILLEREGAITKSFNINTGINGSEDADVLVVAAGSMHLVKKENVKNNATIVDVGINTLSNNKITGDVDFESVKNKVYAISPVPGGVGPMTIISLLSNLINKKIKEN